MSIAVKLAREVLDMQNEIEHLRYRLARAEEFEAKYNALLSESITHSDQMMFGMLNLGLKMAQDQETIREMSEEKP